VGGYLDTDRRGERADECDAIETFLADSLNRRKFNQRRKTEKSRQ
jgi:hypothetical protein